MHRLVLHNILRLLQNYFCIIYLPTINFNNIECAINIMQNRYISVFVLHNIASTHVRK